MSRYLELAERADTAAHDVAQTHLGEYAGDAEPDLVANVEH